MRALVLTLFLGACSSLPLGLLGGGGPNVAANTQIGRENRQAISSMEFGDTAGRDIVSKELEAGQVESLNITNQDIPPWVILLMLLGWLAPSPGEIGRGIYKLLRG